MSIVTLKDLRFFENKKCLGLYSGPGTCITGQQAANGTGKLVLESGVVWTGTFIKGRRIEGSVVYSPSICYEENWLGERLLKRNRSRDLNCETYPWLGENPKDKKFITEILRDMKIVSMSSKKKGVYVDDDKTKRKKDLLERKLFNAGFRDKIIGVFKSSWGLICFGEAGITVIDQEQPTLWFINWEDFVLNSQVAGKNWDLNGKLLKLDGKTLAFFREIDPKIRKLFKECTLNTQQSSGQGGTTIVIIENHQSQSSPPPVSTGPPKIGSVPVTNDQHFFPPSTVQIGAGARWVSPTTPGNGSPTVQSKDRPTTLGGSGSVNSSSSGSTTSSIWNQDGYLQASVRGDTQTNSQSRTKELCQDIFVLESY